MANNKPESRLIRAAGAVAWRPGPDGEPEILLVHRTKYDDWSLPKGKVDPGEPLPVTAAREVLEEGGTRLVLGRRLRSVRYQVGGRPKRVHYWAAQATGTDPDAVPNSEVDRVAWVTLEQAWERVSYGHDVTILEDFARASADTFPLILLRHAKAEGKSSWKRDDLSRPLDDYGRAHAKALADLLAAFAPSARLVSSPAVRCVDTLRPFAQLSGAPVREAPELYVHHQADGTGAADPATLIADAVAAGEPAVFCAHRENIPQLQAAALAALGLSGTPTGIRDGGDPPLAPGRSRGQSAPRDPAASRDRPEGAPSNGEPLSEFGRDEFTLPRDWHTPLSTASFWVLHLTRPKPQAPPGQAPDAGRASDRGSTSGSGQAGTRPTARQRLRLRWLPGRARPVAQPPIAPQPTTIAQPAITPQSGVNAQPSGNAESRGNAESWGNAPEAAPVRPVTLVATDRYDITDVLTRPCSLSPARFAGPRVLRRPQGASLVPGCFAGPECFAGPRVLRRLQRADRHCGRRPCDLSGLWLVRSTSGLLRIGVARFPGWFALF